MSRDLDAGLSKGVRGPIGDDASGDGALGRDRAEEEMSIGTLRPTMLEVVEHPLSDLHRERIRGPVPGLSGTDMEHRGTPVDVVQRLRGDFARTQAVDDQQEEHGVVPLPHPRPAVDDAQHAMDIVRGD